MSRITYEPNIREKAFTHASQALAHLVESTLIMIETLSLRKKPPKGELSRHCVVASTGLYVLVVSLAHLSLHPRTSELAGIVRELQDMNSDTVYDVVCCWAQNIHEGRK